MNIGVTGATGFIGARVVELAKARGHRVVGFSRDALRPIRGCYETREFSLNREPDVGGCDAIIHLAGENVFGIWTKAKRQRIRGSRVLGTRQLVNAIARSSQPPRVLVSCSGIAFYGDTGDATADENAPTGEGFLTEVTHEWEAEALRARRSGVSVALLRTSLVLGRNGGALKTMLPLFRLGLGAQLGSGEQWASWIHLDDEAALALFAVENEKASGPLNATSPEPVRNADFTDELADAVGQRAFFKVPAFVLQALTGEFSRELLDSKRIVPKRALDAGFVFRFPNLRDALADLLR